MSTHCLIGKILNDSGKCRVIYCHMDGGLQDAGRKLNTYFKKESDVDKLLDLGNLSYLGEIPKSDPKLWTTSLAGDEKACRAYKDRGDKGEEAIIFNSVKEARKEMNEIYNYFYIDGKWYCIVTSVLSKDRSIIDLETGKNIEEKVECLMENIENYFDKEWVYDDNYEVIEVRWNGKTLKLGEKIGDEYVTGFNPDTNTVFLDEDPEVLGGSDYSAEDVFDWKDEQLAKQESLTEAEEQVEVEEKETIDQYPNEGLKVGDKVTIKGLGEDSPWEGLYGEVTWVDEEDFADDFQTITVRVTFPTADGDREIEQNFDRRNVVKTMGESLNEEKTGVSYKGFTLFPGTKDKEGWYAKDKDDEFVPGASGFSTQEELEEYIDNHILNKTAIHNEDELIDKIISVNKLNHNKTNEYGSEEYWIADSIRNLSDLDDTWRDYIKGKDEDLKKAFLAITGYEVEDEEETQEESLTEEKQVDKNGDVVIDTIEIPHEEYTSREDIIRINNELDEKAKAGKLLGLRKEKNMLMLAEPAINGIWTLFLNDKGGIIKITLW